MTQIQVTWSSLKSFLTKRSINTQWYTNDAGDYFIYGIDTDLALWTVIPIDGSDDTNKVDFETNYKASGNTRLTTTFSTRTDTFTTASSGTAVDVHTNPMSSFALQVSATGSVTSWTVLLEGSLDNTNFDTLATHTNATPGNNKISLTYALATLPIPVLYFRTRCSAISLGSGTNVIATILGIQ